MRAIIIAADAVDPKLIIKYRSELPTINKMISNGAFIPFHAYTGWNYKSAYKSEQNWATIFTGLTPSEHGINYMMGVSARPPRMDDFSGLKPFWEVVNLNGYSVGLWHADLCNHPVPINGYSVSAYYDPIESPVEKRDTELKIQFCSNGKKISSFLEGKPPVYIYPKTLSQLGYRFEDLKSDPDLAEYVISEYHYQEAVDNFDYELNYFFSAMARTQRNNPVDVLWFATPSTDRIAHFSMYNDQPDVLIDCYKLLDRYMGCLIDEFSPDAAIFLSDHGQQNYIEFVKCSDKDIQREAFDSRDNVIWLNNGNIAFEGDNGALLFTSHAPNGSFIISGKGIRSCVNNEMRIVDIYPTLLETLGVRVPSGRSGYVADIFVHDVLNNDRLLTPGVMDRKKIAFIQTHSMGTSERFISKLFLQNRFADITIIGEEKYREMFTNNPRVNSFISFSEYNGESCLDPFDSVFVGLYNESNDFMEHFKVR